MNDEGKRFSTHDFKAALAMLESRGKMTPIRRKMLTIQYSAPGRVITEPELTASMGWSGHKSNLDYGRLGKLIASELPGVGAESAESGWPFLSAGEWRESASLLWPGQRFHWTMHAALAQALEEMGWVNQASPPQADSEPFEPVFGELPSHTYTEGATRQVTVNAFERSRAARLAAIAYHGSIYAVCDSDPEEMYGPIAFGFVHVHHLKPLSELRAGYTVDPKTGLVPVCPNCHAMLHRQEPPLRVQELRDMIQEAHR